MRGLQSISALLLFSGTCLAQGWVVIPVDQYGALRSKAYPTIGEPSAPPMEATLTRVDYDLRVEGALASGRASLTVDVLKDGWVRVPIPAGLLVRDAKLGADRVALVPMPGRGGQLSAVLSHKGRAMLSLDVAFPVTSAGAEERLSLPAGASGITRASVVPESPDFDLTVTGGFQPEKLPGRWIAFARGNEALTFAWRRKTIEQPRVELPLRWRGSMAQLFALGEDSTTVNAEVSVEVLQGAARQVRIAVPEGVTINQVPGAMIANWDVKGGELLVDFLEPVESTARFTVSGDTHLPREGALDIPLLHLLGAERDGGGVAVEVLGAGEIKETKPQGLEPAEAAELGPMIAAHQSPSTVAYRLRPGGAAPALHMLVARYAQQAVLTALVEEARYRVLLSPEGKTLVQARYAVRNNQRSFVRIALPNGAAVWSASLAGRLVRPGSAPDGSLLFPLMKSRAGEDAPLFAVEIVYLVRDREWDARGKTTLALPMLDLPISRTGLLLYYPPLFRVTPETGAFRAQPFEAPASPVLSSDAAAGPPIPTAAPPANSATQSLVDRYLAHSNTRRAAAPAPIAVSFPAVGPSLYLASELTGESKAPAVSLDYQKEKKGGVK